MEHVTSYLLILLIDRHVFGVEIIRNYNQMNHCDDSCLNSNSIITVREEIEKNIECLSVVIV